MQGGVVLSASEDADPASLISAEAVHAMLHDVQAVESVQALEALRVSLLGKKGILTEALKGLAALPPEARKAAGAGLNLCKQQVSEAVDARKNLLMLQEEAARLVNESLDITLDASPWKQGSRHPISQVIAEITDILALMGFAPRTGPLIEDDEHNFGALNIPAHHPARQMHDTFYVHDPLTGDIGRYVLRTHTSPVQIRTMRAEKPPIRVIAAGSTFRSDSDMTHTPMFHQIEGLYIAQDVHMGHLKGCVSQFLRLFFGKDDLRVRFRPSFFPFTEPSAEIDIGCRRSRETIAIGEGDDWLEVMGCGMVHPNVLRACNLDPEIYQGFAFGMGVERLAMLKYNIPDLRTFFDSDQPWLNHYGFRAL
jgi:phenylalanyl-tRNA synthetase alpha chain